MASALHSRSVSEQIQSEIRFCHHHLLDPPTSGSIENKMGKIAASLETLTKQTESTATDLQDRLQILVDDLDCLKIRARIAYREITRTFSKDELREWSRHSSQTENLTVRGMPKNMTPANIDTFLKAYFEYKWVLDLAMRCVTNKEEDEIRSKRLEALGEADKVFSAVKKETGLNICS